MIDRMSNRSIRLYAREHAARNLPLLYSSDSSSDDLPYWVPSPLATEGKHDTGLLMVPFTVDTSDFRFIAKGSGWSSPVDFYDYLVCATLHKCYFLNMVRRLIPSTIFMRKGGMESQK